jgi:prepilin-type N-terminal cleavage/methylation domain-containing protein
MKAAKKKIKFYPPIFPRGNNSGLLLKKGFTLVEALLVAAIFSIIAVGIASTLFSGIRMWGWFNSLDSDYADTVFAMEGISQHLRQSLNNAHIGFEGSAHELSFPAVSGNFVFKVVYFFNPDEKLLSRKIIPLRDIMLGKDDEDDYIEEKALSPDEFSFEYLTLDSESGSYKWKESWEKEEGIFSAVRIKGRLKDEEIAKIVFIPIAKR